MSYRTSTSERDAQILLDQTLGFAEDWQRDLYELSIRSHQENNSRAELTAIDNALEVLRNELNQAMGGNLTPEMWGRILDATVWAPQAPGDGPERLGHGRLQRRSQPQASVAPSQHSNQREESGRGLPPAYSSRRSHSRSVSQGSQRIPQPLVGSAAPQRPYRGVQQRDESLRTPLSSYASTSYGEGSEAPPSYRTIDERDEPPRRPISSLYGASSRGNSLPRNDYPQRPADFEAPALRQALIPYNQAQENYARQPSRQSILDRRPGPQQRPGFFAHPLNTRLPNNLLYDQNTNRAVVLHPLGNNINAVVPRPRTFENQGPYALVPLGGLGGLNSRWGNNWHSRNLEERVHILEQLVYNLEAARGSGRDSRRRRLPLGGYRYP